MSETDVGAGKWDGSGDRKADRIGSALMACLHDWLKKGLRPGLHLVATPIGNLGDISPRALAAIATAERVYCEDTRTSRQLFTRFAIDRPLKAYHEYSAEAVRDEIVEAVIHGDTVALVSEAGMPAISDPGFKLARAVIAAGGDVFVIPGPTAVTAAVTVSGLPTDSFFFGGFLPQKGSGRRARIGALSSIPSTLVIYESPHRLKPALQDLADVLGDRDAAVVREQTKKFEEVRRGTLTELAAWSRDVAPRGEIAIVIGPAPEPSAGAVDDATIIAALHEALATERPSRAAKQVAESLGVPRGHVYQLAVRLKGEAE
jgi:16S rRNA (cytidine1402-2'-O)-methyltransferase